MSNPVPGLEFDDSQLLYNGIPVSPDSLSYSEIIELGVKMKIAENPDLPLFISNGESIGIQRLNDIKEIAKRSNLQIIMEQVERTSNNSNFIMARLFKANYYRCGAALRWWIYCLYLPGRFTYYFLLACQRF